MLSFIQDDTRNTAELARIVSADPGLSARLIRVSNSAYYGFPRRLSTVREAVLVLGFRQVRQIVLGANLIDTWRRTTTCPGFNIDTFWNHSLIVAMGAEAAARFSGSFQPEEAFTAGLLHDVGVLAMLVGGRDGLQDAMARVGAGESLHDAERSVFGFDHAELGGVLANSWNFPEQLVAAAADHHNPAAGGLARLVAIADSLASANGLQPGFWTSNVPAPDDPRFEALERAGAGFLPLQRRSRAFIESVCGPTQYRDTTAA